jgi:hypothetical protein
MPLNRDSLRVAGWQTRLLAWLALPACLSAQTAAEWKSVLERLDRLERHNQRLQQEVAELRKQVSDAIRPSQPNEGVRVEERLDIQERRLEEQAQTKVEASQRFPIRVSGMALFNVFLNSRFAGGADNPPLASRLAAGSGGATFRQSVIGLQYQGPATLLGGKVSGSLFADFFGGSNDPLGHTFRVRTASVEIDWSSRSLLFGQEKPIIAPREPNSLAQVGISPLTGAGNLWRWQPQVRLEQRLKLSESSRLSLQIGAVQINDEPPTTLDGDYAPTVSRRRPGLQGRFLLSQAIDDNRRVEFAPGFHVSTSHVAGVSVPSRAFSLDWFANPVEKIEFSGAFFAGRNLGHFGAPRQGFTVRYHDVIPVHSRGGWAQFTLLATSRLSFNFMGGRHDDRNSDLTYEMIGKNTIGAANLMYRLAPNVILSLEAAQVRTDYLATGLRINNHYDLAVAYLF